VDDLHEPTIIVRGHPALEADTAVQVKYRVTPLAPFFWQQALSESMRLLAQVALNMPVGSYNVITFAASLAILEYIEYGSSFL